MRLNSPNRNSPFGLLILILCLFSFFGSFCQNDSENTELIINTVEDEIRYESVLEYELDFDQSKRFLTTEQLYNCHYQFSYYFSKKYDFSRALMHALEALNYAEKLDDISKQGNMHLDIARIYLNVQNAAEAVKSSHAAIEAFNNIKDTVLLIQSYNELANSKLSSGAFTEGLKWYSESLRLTQMIDDPEMAMIPISNLGAYYLFRGEPDSAIVFIDQAVEFDRHSRSQANLAMAYGNKAYAYTLKEDYELAKTYFDSSFTIAIDQDLKLVLLNLYKDRSDMYFAIGDYKQSYTDLLKYQRINDSLKNSVSSDQIADWKVAFANEEKKRELLKEHARYNELQLNQEIKNYINWFIIVVVTLVSAIISILFWRYRTKASKTKQLLEKDLELERLKGLLSKKNRSEN